MSRKLRGLAKKAVDATEKRFSNAGIDRREEGSRRGTVPHTKRRLYREMNEIGRRSPGFASVKKHTAFVKRFANAVARQLAEKGYAVDRGLVVSSALAHDSRRDFKDQDLQAQVTWAKRGAPEVARTIGTGEAWTLKNSPTWATESKIVALSDNICRGVKVGDTFLNGVVPSKTAFRLLVSQRQASSRRVSALVRERQAVLKFEKDLKKAGVDVDQIVKEQMKRNPKSFLRNVEAQIDPKVDEIVKAAMRRLKITRLKY